MIFYIVLFGNAIYIMEIVYLLNEYNNKKDYGIVNRNYKIIEEYVFVPKRIANLHYDSEWENVLKEGKS